MIFLDIITFAPFHLCDIWAKKVNEKGPLETGTKTFKQQLGLKDVT